MGKIKKIIAILICFTMVLTLFPNVEVQAKGISISKCSITISKTSLNYTGKACKPTVKVKYNGKTLKVNRDYTLKYSKNINPGPATVTITGKGQYSGSINRQFKIVNALKVTTDKKEYKYTGKAIKPKLTVQYGKKKLSANNYSVSYKNNKKVGTATIIVKGKGAYKGKNALITFKITKAIPKGKLELDKTNGILLTGDNYTVKVKKCQGKLSYSSSNGRVLSVDNDGRVQAHDAGSAVITVKDSKNSVKLNIKVIRFDFSFRSQKLRPAATKQVEITKGEGSAQYTWESDNTAVATVNQKGLITAVVGKGGKANIRLAVNTLKGKSYSEAIEIEVVGIKEIYKVKKTGSTYKTAKGNVTTPLTNGQGADLNLVEGGLTTAGSEGDGYWHNTGLSTITYNGYNYYFVADTWNNRVLVYKVAKGTAWGYNNHSVLKNLYCVIGQKSSKAIKAGYALDELNWPNAAAASIVNNKLKVYVTDSYNNRILVWEDLFSTVGSMSPVGGVYYAPAADYSIMEKCDTRKVAFNTGNLAGTKLVNESEAGVKWPWAIWTDGTRLLCTSTQDGCLMIWDSLPSKTDKYPDKLVQMGGTIRTIACKDKYLLLGDHNIDTGHGIVQGLKIINNYDSLPYKTIKSKTDSTALFKYAEIGCGDGNTGYAYYTVDGHQPTGTFLEKDLTLDNGTKLKAGTLLLNCIGSVEVRKDGKIDGNNDPADYYIGGGVVEDTRLFRFTSADYAPVIVDADNNMYVSMGNTGIIAGYKSGKIPSEPANLPKDKSNLQLGEELLYNGTLYIRNRETGAIEKHCTAFPNIWIGAQKATDDAYKESYRYQNCMVSSDGKYLAATSDHGTGSILMLWKNIPDQSNAIPDTIYTFTVEDVLKDTAMYNNGTTTMLITGGGYSVMIWKDINTALNGEAPDIYYRDKIGTIKVNEIKSYAYDGTYFYLSDNNGTYIFNGLPKSNQAPVSTINCRGGHIKVTKCTNGEVYVGLVNDGEPRIYKRSEAIKNGTYYTLKGAVRKYVPGLEGDDISGAKKAPEKREQAAFNGVSEVIITKEGKVVVSDTGFFRVIIWESIDEAVKEGKTNTRKASTIELGYGADYYDIWDVLKADSSNYYHSYVCDETSMESPTTLFRPYSLSYDGNYLWIGDFKFSGGIKRFSGKLK